MKRVIVVQKLSYEPRRNIYEDNLDIRWINFLLRCDLFPIIVPNNIRYIKEFYKNEKIDGILLTGGDNPQETDKKLSTRAKVEKFLIKKAIENNIPILGVCRGMQAIQIYFKSNLKRVVNHVNTEHHLKIKNKDLFQEVILNYKKVNSYHDFGVKKDNKYLITLAKSDDGVIECVSHIEKKILGIMWHPERQAKTNINDIKLFKIFFGVFK